jgi:lycopene cyclase domain-containing protein
MYYLYWLGLTIWLPSIILWLFVKNPILPGLKSSARLGVIVLITQLPVEYLTLRYAMVMYDGHYLGIRILSFPVEDFLFFLTIPFLVFPLAGLVDDHLSSRC